MKLRNNSVKKQEKTLTHLNLFGKYILLEQAVTKFIEKYKEMFDYQMYKELPFGRKEVEKLLINFPNNFIAGYRGDVLLIRFVDMDEENMTNGSIQFPYMKEIELIELIREILET